MAGPRRGARIEGLRTRPLAGQHCTEVHHDDAEVTVTIGFVALWWAMVGAGWAAPRAPGPYALASEMLRVGQPARAREMALLCRDRRPDAPGCLAVLARSNAALGLCEVALAQLGEVRTTRAWDHDAAMAEAVCHVQVGDLSAAEAAFDEAHRLAPWKGAPHLQSVLLFARTGDVDGATEELDALGASSPKAWAWDLAELWWGHLVGAAWVDGQLTRWRHHLPERTLQVHVGLLDCLHWLDADAPDRAEDAARWGQEAAFTHERVRACRAEAVRRQGAVAEALTMTQRAVDRGRETPELDAVRVRALADAGRFDEARVLVAEHAQTGHPGMVEAAWYLAWRRGHAPSWTPEGVDVDLLVPLTERP